MEVPVMQSFRYLLLLAVSLTLVPVALAQSPSQANWNPDGSVPAQPRDEAEAVISRPTFPPLVQRSRVSQEGSEKAAKTSSHALSGPTITVASSLAVVLGLFAGTIWLARRFGASARGNRTVPNEAVEMLGSSVIDAKTKLSLIRIGTRVVVLAHSAQGVHPISEITNLDEANELIATCRGDSKRGFAEQLKSMEREPHSPGFIGTTNEPSTRRRLFATA
jgi:flagellar protein FliO/FliZ